MSHSPRPHHKICGSCSSGCGPAISSDQTVVRVSEHGYTLVALLAVMTLLATFAMAVAPSIEQHVQRERESEAIFRGEQVADAIRSYYLYKTATLRVVGDQALPSSMDQLLEGIPIQGGSKNRQILRVSAARDPLTPDGEWRFIHPRSEQLIDFERAVMTYANSFLPTPRSPQMAQLQQFAAPQITSLLNTGTSTTVSGTSSASDDSSGPFVGVSSRSRRQSVLYYYGIDRHDQWIFTPLFRR